MANQLSKEAKRISLIIEEIEDYNNTISELEYQICDVPQAQLEEDKDDLRDEQKRLQNLVNTMTNDLKFDDNCVIEYDGRLTQVYRNDNLWLECYRGKGGYGWIEHEEATIIRNRRVAFLQGFAWDRVSDALLDEVMAFMKAHGFDAVK